MSINVSTCTSTSISTITTTSIAGLLQPLIYLLYDSRFIHDRLQFSYRVKSEQLIRNKSFRRFNEMTKHRFALHAIKTKKKKENK